MKLLLGGNALEKLLYTVQFEGIIGIGYSNIFTGFLTAAIILIILALAIIGLVQVIKWIGWGLPNKKEKKENRK